MNIKPIKKRSHQQAADRSSQSVSVEKSAGNELALTGKQLDRYQRIRFKVQRGLRSERVQKRLGKYGHQAAELIALAPDMFHLMCKLTLDKRVPIKEKAKLGFAIAYFASPIDLIPVTLTGPIGFLDDLALSAYVLNSLLNQVDADIVREHWAGEQDILTVLQDISSWADSFLSTSVFDKLRDWVDNKPQLPFRKDKNAVPTSSKPKLTDDIN